MMWLARVHSTGRMGFPRDEERARDIAAGVIREVQRAAESGVLEAVFLYAKQCKKCKPSKAKFLFGR